MMLRIMLGFMFFIVVFLILWKTLSKAFVPPLQAKEELPLPSSINELKVIKEELEDKLELLSNKKEIEEIKSKIHAVNAKLADYA